MDFGPILSGDALEVVLPYDDGGGTVTIRYVPREQMRTLLRQASRNKWVKGKAVPETDNDKLSVLLGRAAVGGWDGHTADGEPLAYSPEACDRLMVAAPDFADFVVAACTDYARLVDAQREDAKKNSKPMLSIASTTKG